MTRLEIAARILAGWAANPHMRAMNEEAAAGALALADALLDAAGETAPKDARVADALAAEKKRADEAHAAGFRECQERAAKVAESVPYVGGAKGDVAWREACDAIRALTPAAPAEKPAPPFAPVKFDENQRALLANGDVAEQVRDGWDALSDGNRYLAVYLWLRPGEDAGVTTAKILAAVGRSA